MPTFEEYSYDMDLTTSTATPYYYYENPTSISNQLIAPPLTHQTSQQEQQQQQQEMQFIPTIPIARQRSSLYERTTTTRHGPPRIPRLRRPTPDYSQSSSSSSSSQRFYHLSISSAISTTTGRMHLQDNCLDSIDLRSLFGDGLIGALQQKEGLDYLDFRLASHYNINSYGIKNYITYHDGAVFSVIDSQKTTNMVLKYVGHKNSCAVSQVILRSPQTGQLPPSREGMIFISHQPIHIEDTYPFNHFTKKDFDQYQKTNDNDFLAAWFEIDNGQPTVVDLGDRSGKYILIKYFPKEADVDSIDLQYVAFVGYVGTRSFTKGDLC